jgi:hypothetical protein
VGIPESGPALSMPFDKATWASHCDGGRDKYKRWTHKRSIVLPPADAGLTIEACYSAQFQLQ